MYSINFKSKASQHDKNQITVEMIFYCTGYARVPKVTKISGLAKDWNENTQRFHLKSPDAAKKNLKLATLFTGTI